MMEEEEREARLWMYRAAVVFLVIWLILLYSFQAGHIDEEVAEKTLVMQRKLQALIEETQTTVRQSVALLQTELNQVRMNTDALRTDQKSDVAVLKRYRCP